MCISFFNFIHSLLAKSPTKVAKVATSDWYTIISITIENVSLFRMFCMANCVKESTSPYSADATIVHMNPATKFPLEALEEPASSSSGNTRSTDEKVRSTRELTI
ncbi:hypothetical protein PanWU01x14_301070 [Parasponia andersonii]|uniref:Uncharacterized protein n=1 Tax=Parasponia andersonii TaxID=3476 RepID=A0A2P5ATT3_PARAD|nr:hypothetical protein PanWU01x14_301070 [Parasponia andersonii]